MLDRASVQTWLDGYVHAWKTYDSQEIGNLFSEDVRYHYTPCATALDGRAAIVAAWLEDRDPPGTYDGRYEPLVIEGDRAVAQGRSLYFQEDGATLRTEFDNIFLLCFDREGRCSEYREWYMERLDGE